MLKASCPLGFWPGFALSNIGWKPRLVLRSWYGALASSLWPKKASAARKVSAMTAGDTPWPTSFMKP